MGLLTQEHLDLIGIAEFSVEIEVIDQVACILQRGRLTWTHHAIDFQ